MTERSGVREARAVSQTEKSLLSWARNIRAEERYFAREYRDAVKSRGTARCTVTSPLYAVML